MLKSTFIKRTIKNYKRHSDYNKSNQIILFFFLLLLLAVVVAVVVMLIVILLFNLKVCKIKLKELFIVRENRSFLCMSK